jgi:hypothetical protein
LYRREGDCCRPPADRRPAPDGANPSRAPGTSRKPAAAEVTAEEAARRQRRAEGAVEIADQYGMLVELSDGIGVPPAALRRLCTGIDLECWPESGRSAVVWQFPERDGGPLDLIVGHSLRLKNAKKLSRAGQSRGLIYDPNDFRGDKGPVRVFAPEGPTDTASFVAMGLTAAGRSNNSGGSEELARLSGRQNLAGADLIIVGENDGRWAMDKRTDEAVWRQPGLEGRKPAQQVANALGRATYFALPPQGFKDTRAWMNHQVQARGLDINDVAVMTELGREFEALLLANAERISPAPAADAIDLDLSDFDLAPGEMPAKPPEDIPASPAPPPMTAEELDNAKLMATSILAAVVPPPRRLVLEIDLANLNDGEDEGEMVLGKKAKGCGLVMELAHKVEPRLIHMSTKCGEWKCGVCYRSLRTVWGNHLAKVVKKCPKLYCWVGPREAWASIAKSINTKGRAEGLWEKSGLRRVRNRTTGQEKEVDAGSVGYWKYDQHGANMFVMSEAPFRVPRKFGGAVMELDGQFAESLTGLIIGNIPQSPKRCLSASHKWALPEEERSHEWRRVRAVGHLPLWKHQHVLLKYGVTYERWVWEGNKQKPWKLNWVLEVSGIEGMAPAKIIALYVELKADPDPPQQREAG